MSEANVPVSHEHPTKMPAGEEYTRAGRAYRPNVDIAETETGLWLWADMPGVDEGSVEVSLEDAVLSIQGHVSTGEYDNLDPIYTEYNVGHFAHRFRLSNQIDGDRIEARMKHGVLQLHLPKVEQAKPRKIAIEAA